MFCMFRHVHQMNITQRDIQILQSLRVENNLYKRGGLLGLNIEWDEVVE